MASSTGSGSRSTPLSRVLASIAAQSGLRLASMAASIATTALIARYLSIEEFAALSRALAYVTFFGIFADLGLGAVVIRQANGDPTKTDQLVCNVAGFSWVYSVPLMFIGVALGWVAFSGDRQAQLGVVILSPAIVTSIVFASYAPSFQVKTRLHRLVAIDFAGRILVLAGSVLVVVLDGGLYWILAVSTFVAVVQLVAVKLESGAGRERLNWQPIAELLRVGWPFMAVGALSFAYMKADAFVIAFLGDDQAVATYLVAYRVFQASLVAASIAAASTIAHLAQVGAGEPDTFSRLFRKGTRVALAVGLIVGVGGFLSSAFLMTFAGGDKYRDGAPVLQVLMVTAVFAYANTFSGSVLVLLDSRRYFLALTSFCVALNIGVNVWAIPQFGAMGAAVAMLLSTVVGVVGTYIYLWRTMGLNLRWLVLLRTVVLLVGAVSLGVFVNTVAPQPTGALVASALLALGLPLAGLVSLDEIRGMIGLPRSGPHG